MNPPDNSPIRRLSTWIEPFLRRVGSSNLGFFLRSIFKAFLSARNGETLSAELRQNSAIANSVEAKRFVEATGPVREKDLLNRFLHVICNDAPNGMNFDALSHCRRLSDMLLKPGFLLKLAAFLLSARGHKV